MLLLTRLELAYRLGILFFKKNCTSCTDKICMQKTSSCSIMVNFFSSVICQHHNNQVTELCVLSWGGFALSHAAPGGDAPVSRLVMLVRHWPVLLDSPICYASVQSERECVCVCVCVCACAFLYVLCVVGLFSTSSDTCVYLCICVSICQRGSQENLQNLLRCLLVDRHPGTSGVPRMVINFPGCLVALSCLYYDARL